MMVNASRHRPLHPLSPASASSSKTVAAKAHPDEHTRTRLLNRLGYFQAPPSGAASIGVNGRRSYSHSSLSPQKVDLRTTLHPSFVRNGGQRRTSTLKDGTSSSTENDSNNDSSRRRVDETEVTAAGSSSEERRESATAEALDKTTSSASSDNDNMDNSNNSNNKKIQFNEVVDILSIPSRHQFSNRIKRVYWSSKEEICSNAERNMLEYEYEGWDYNNVVLDEDMYIDTATGALVHPCHLSVDEHGQPVYHQYAEDDAEQSKDIQEEQLQHQHEEEEDDEYDDSFFKPLQRQSSVASAQ